MAVVFLTGATGFIGKEVLRQLIEAGHEVMALVRSREKWDRLAESFTAEQKMRMTPVKGDMAQHRLGVEESLQTWLIQRVEVIVHTAAPMDIDLKREEARRIILEGTHELIALTRQMHEEGALRHFVHVVGYMSPFRENGIDDAMTSLDEESFMPTASQYERYKFMADYLIRQESKQMGMALSVVNPGTVIGNRHTGSTEQLGGFGLLVDAARRGMMPVVPGGSTHWLPLIALDDLARMIVTIVNQQAGKGDTYFALADRQESLDMKGLLKLIARELGTRAPRIAVPIHVLGTLLKWGGNLAGGLSAHSLDFITAKTFPVESVSRLRKNTSVEELDVRETLPFVVADLDYRFSGGTTPDGWKRDRKGDLAALVREGSEQEGTWVFVHGTFSDANQFEPLARHMTGSSVWLLDLPGFGRSPLHHQDDWVEGCVRAVAKAVREASHPVHLVGHSFGGLIASRVARLMPDRIAHLYLLQPAVRPAQKLPFPVRLASRNPALFGMMSSKERVKKMLIASSAFEQEADIPESYLHCILAQMGSPRARKANALSLASIQSYARAQINGAPVGEGGNCTILWGEQDTAYRLPDTGVKVIGLPHSHQFPLAYPRETAEILKRVARKAL